MKQKFVNKMIVCRIKVLYLTIVCFCIAGLALPASDAVSAEPGQTKKQSVEQADAKRLEGRWMRPDGGYILELSNIGKEGSITAAYFNPRPIKVFSSQWSRKGGKLNLFVELRDVNYPGSKYDLFYDSAADRLKGTYFQALEKQTYNIEFVRAK